MPFSRASFALYTILLIFSSAMSRATRAGDASDGMHAYADLLRAEGAFLVDVSLARLNFARANLINAQAAFEWERARMLSLLVDRLALELRHLRQDEYYARALIKQIDDAANRVGVINTGKTSPYVFQAFRFLLIKAVPSETVLEAMSVTVPSYSADNFIPNRKGVVPESFKGGNVGMLFTFLDKKNYSLEPFRESHLALLHSLQQMADAANEKITRIRDQMQDLRDGTLDIWKIPPGQLQPYPGMGSNPPNPQPVPTP